MIKQRSFFQTFEMVQYNLDCASLVIEHRNSDLVNWFGQNRIEKIMPNLMQQFYNKTHAQLVGLASSFGAFNFRLILMKKTRRNNNRTKLPPSVPQMQKDAI